jgi:hypothetical protein
VIDEVVLPVGRERLLGGGDGDVWERLCHLAELHGGVSDHAWPPTLARCLLTRDRKRSMIGVEPRLTRSRLTA